MKSKVKKTTIKYQIPNLRELTKNNQKVAIQSNK